MILSLDISTSVVGYCILDENNNIVLLDAFDLKNKKHYPDIFCKAQEIKHVLEDIKTSYNITHIYIEDALMLFAPGKSSAVTISTLLKFNGIVSYICYLVFDIKPNFISASSARKTYGITIPRGSKAKKVVMEHIRKTEPQLIIKLTPKGNPVPKYYDQIDALVIARAGYIKQTT